MPRTRRAAHVRHGMSLMLCDFTALRQACPRPRWLGPKWSSPVIAPVSLQSIRAREAPRILFICIMRSLLCRLRCNTAPVSAYDTSDACTRSHLDVASCSVTPTTAACNHDCTQDQPLPNTQTADCPCRCRCTEDVLHSHCKAAVYSVSSTAPAAHAGRDVSSILSLHRCCNIFP